MIILDVMMPGEDGVSFTRSLRADWATPILLLTAKGDTNDRIAGLEAGADDYLPKPFEPKELLLRINAISCGGISVTTVGWIPLASTRQGTSTAAPVGSCGIRP